ncbi:MAG TPA: ABC transporter substrate-binding protein [Hyphomicrobiaceae bacterium]|nr:ABC transporter substrate-binding protein [Hyphomicrobiaceae bacterium]
MRQRFDAFLRLWGAAAVVAGGATVAAAGPPQRIVSLDLCTDQLVIDLAPRQRIAAVTHLAADPSVSAIPDKARGLPVTRGGAEDVLRYDPDLVLAGPYGVTATVDLLRRLGRNVVVVPLAQDIDGIRASVRSVAVAIGDAPGGEKAIADFNRRLDALHLAAEPSRRPTAIVYQVGGVVSGQGSLADALLTATGFHNLAGDYRLTHAGQVPLEAMVAKPPDLLILSSSPSEYPTAIADNLRHPAVAWLRAHRASLELSWPLWLCGTPHVLEAMERLAAARDSLRAR